MKDSGKKAWGIGLLLFGLLYLVQKLNIVPDVIMAYILDMRNLPIAIGAVLLFSQRNRSVGIFLIIIGILLYLKDIIIWTRSLSDFLWPILLISAGLILIFTSKGKGK